MPSQSRGEGRPFAKAGCIALCLLLIASCSREGGNEAVDTPAPQPAAAQPPVRVAGKAPAPERNGNALHEAVRAGDAARIAELVAKQRALVSGKDRDGNMPLHLAVKAKNGAAIRALLPPGTSVFGANNDGLHALHLAIQVDLDPELIALFYARRANAQVKNAQGDTALHMAIRLERVGILKAMFGHDKSLPLAWENAQKQTPIELALATGNAEVVQMLLARGGSRVLWPLIRADKIEALAKCTEFDAQALRRTTKSGESLLHLAAGANRLAVAKFLIDQGADVMARSKKRQRTPLHYAAAGAASKSIIDLLVAHGADVNAEDKSGYAPLHLACLNGSPRAPETLAALVAHGADVNRREGGRADGYLPIHYAALHGRLANVKKMAELGADLKLAADGHGLLHQAARSGTAAAAVVAFLLDQGLDVNGKDQARGQTPLHYAVLSAKNAAVVKLLLERGATVDVTNLWGRKLIDDAREEIRPLLK